MNKGFIAFGPFAGSWLESPFDHLHVEGLTSNGREGFYHTFLDKNDDGESVRHWVPGLHLSAGMLGALRGLPDDGEPDFQWRTDRLPE